MVIAAVLKISMQVHSSLYFSISFTMVRTVLEMAYEEGLTEPESMRSSDIILNFYKVCKVLRIKEIIFICT